MNPVKFNILFLLLNVLFISTTFSQNNESDANSTSLKKNVIYGTYGLGAQNGNYERMLGKPIENQFFKSFWLKIGYGAFEELFGDKGTNFTAGLTTLTGSKKGHLELNVGLTSLSDLSLAGAIGFRFHKPNGIFVFRTGIGYPEFIYLGVGVGF